MLPVQFDEAGGGLGEGADRGHPAVDPRLGTATADHRSRQHHLALAVHLAVVTLATVVVPLRRSRSGQTRESALDHGLVGSGPYHRRVGASAEQQADRLHQQRLAGTRLTGERGHPRAEGHGDIVDDPEVADPELDQGGTHRRRRPYRSAKWNLARRMAWKSRVPNVSSRAG